MQKILTLNRPWFALGRHDIRSNLPAALQGIMQDGLLDRTFQDALVPEFLFPGVATSRPWAANMGDTQHFTRRGLLTPQTTPLGGVDPTPEAYSAERYSMTMDQYGHTVDTNMLESAMTLASTFLKDIQTLGINAGQSVNRIARNKLYKAYAGGRTWAPALGTATVTMVVDSTDGLETTLVNGIQTAVSATNPIMVSINGAAAVAVDGVNAGTNTLTFNAAQTWAAGDSVVAANAPVSYRPGAKASAVDLTGADVATFSLFRDAVVRLRTMNVPTLGGAHVAHIDPTTEGQLFADSEFQALYRGAVESPVWGNLALGRFGGIDWVRNNEAQTRSNGTISYHEPIVLGADAFVAGPFSEMGSLLSQVPEGSSVDVQMVSVGPAIQVARIIRPPQDRLAQVIASSWSYVGDFAVPSDETTGDAASFKRGVVVQHA